MTRRNRPHNHYAPHQAARRRLGALIVVWRQQTAAGNVWRSRVASGSIIFATRGAGAAARVSNFLDGKA